jgi:two-component system sensor histidine kinase UhpB
MEQKTAKFNLEKQPQHCIAFMENSSSLAWITDRKGVLLYMNNRFKKSYNYTNAHLNRKIGTISKITDREKILLPHKEVLLNNKALEFVHEWMDQSKNVHYFKTFKFPIKIANGDHLEAGESIEITREFFTLENLKKGNELFEYASKATRDVIWDWNPEDNKIRRLGGFENLFGYRTNEMYEELDFNKIHENDLPIVLKIIEDSLKTKASRWQMEYKYLCADGSYKKVIDQAYIIRDAKGKPVRIIGSMQDVTEERDLQNKVLTAEIKKNKEVVSAVIAAQEKERNELSAELHDNVNQLLAATLLYLKNAQKQKIIDTNLITHSIDYIEKAIQELRNISRNLTPSELIMNGLSVALRALAEKLQISKEYQVRLKIGLSDEKIVPMAVQLALYRIAQEEVNNILKHSGASKIHIHLFEKDNNILLKVSDNGKGFDLAKIKHGLGITNINNRAENFGGFAELSSSPGKGCTWLVKIPIN